MHSIPLTIDEHEVTLHCLHRTHFATALLFLSLFLLQLLSELSIAQVPVQEIRIVNRRDPGNEPVRSSLMPMFVSRR